MTSPGTVPASLPEEIANEVRDYLRDLRKERDSGFSNEAILKQLQDQGEATRNALRTVADGLNRHEIECIKQRELNQKREEDRKREHEELKSRVNILEREILKKRMDAEAALKANLPPMRPELDSSHDRIEEATLAAGRAASMSPKVNMSGPELAKLIEPAVKAAVEAEKQAERMKALEALERQQLEAAAEAKRIKEAAEGEAKRLKAESDARAKKLQDQADEDARVARANVLKVRTRFMLAMIALLSAAGMALITVMTNAANERTKAIAQAHAEGHSEAVAEVRAISQVPAAWSTATGSAPMPASAAPAKK